MLEFYYSLNNTISIINKINIKFNNIWKLRNNIQFKLLLKFCIIINLKL